MGKAVHADIRSPNYSDRQGAPVSLLVMHYTGMQSGAQAIERLCLAEAKVSAHYVVEEDGAVWNLVDEAHCAWHAGVSYWRGRRNVNDISIGIEIVNPGHEWGYRPFPRAQMEAVARLSTDILDRLAIAPRNVVAHSDIAPMRKEDPGEFFDWKWLAGQGIGLWPDLQEASPSLVLQPADTGDGVRDMQASLALYGYDLPQNGIYDLATKKAVIAFQRHFRPRDITGAWDGECQRLLELLLDAI